jgi:hypothetical protein
MEIKQDSESHDIIFKMSRIIQNHLEYEDPKKSQLTWKTDNQWECQENTDINIIWQGL